MSSLNIKTGHEFLKRNTSYETRRGGGGGGLIKSMFLDGFKRERGT